MSDLSVTWRGRLLLLLALVLLMTAPDGLAAQDLEPESGDAVEVEAEEGALDSELTAPDRHARIDLDALLREEFEVLSEGETSYDAGGRRDPFVSLFKGPPPPCPDCGNPLLPSIDDLDLTGVFMTAEGPVAQMRWVKQKESLLLREGDELADGDVVSISLEEVTFKKNVSGEIQPFRTVTKRLRPQD